MVLAMFVDADRVPLLAALAGGSVFVTPGVIDPAETPPFARAPLAEFARGVFAAQRDPGHPRHAARIVRRTAFYRAVGDAWTPVDLATTELRLARFFASTEAREAARRTNPRLRVKRIGRGEAETAAVAVARGWTLWSDDAAIINLLAALHPGHPVERISDLLVRAVHEGLLDCEAAAALYNGVFRDTLGLWTSRTLTCIDEGVVVQ
jgi:hypothetical protein